MGGGVYDRGSLTMNGASSISGNDAFAGGGVFVDGGRVVMNDHSSIRDNEGGIRADDGTVVMNDSSSIRGNAKSGGDPPLRHIRSHDERLQHHHRQRLWQRTAGASSSARAPC